MAGLLGVFVARRLAVPLVNLTGTATRITAGEIGLQAAVGGPRETASLASAFNSMTAQLRQTMGSLEQRVTIGRSICNMRSMKSRSVRASRNS